MPGYVYRRPTPPNTPGTSGWFETLLLNDPLVPAGFLFAGSDGAFDVPQKELTAGLNSGGWPPYTGDPTQVAVSRRYVNGLIAPGQGAP